MSQPTADSSAMLRRSLYALLGTIGIGLLIGRILAVDAVDATVVHPRLVDERVSAKREALLQKGVRGTALDEALAKARKQLEATVAVRRPFLSANDRSRWCTVRTLVEPDMRVPGAPYSIDNVFLQPGWDTIDRVYHDGHMYSSKPPLLPTLMAGEYWLIYHLTGWSLATHPFEVGRFMLITLNAIPLAIYFWLLAGLIERFGTTDWGRIFTMAAGVFCTFLTTFGVTITNHLPAAVCATAALYAATRIWFDGRQGIGWFILAGLAAAMMAACELPALALTAVLGAALLWRFPRQTLTGFLPVAGLVAVAFFATSWIAHGSLMPAYGHREWYDYTCRIGNRVIVSYWSDPKGIDVGEKSRAVYALHVLVGHHGIFSLTPIWLLSVAGLLAWIGQRQDRRLRELSLVILTTSLICVAFYLLRPLRDRNYGGLDSGFRWVFWLAPLWLVGMLPAVDAMSRRRWTRVLALALILVSAISVAYPTWNPWTPPWLLDYLQYCGIIAPR